VKGRLRKNAGCRKGVSVGEKGNGELGSEGESPAFKFC